LDSNIHQKKMLYILLTCVLTLCQMFPTMFKSREINYFNQCNSPCHCIACRWCHMHATLDFS